ncbi:MAG: tetratricopeptide repeat protein [Pseudomonadaceae bacterium]|jgi:putative thioredoxin|nr:tetratricopeptide repeat protein [Pseudomonadaceae bacterium]
MEPASFNISPETFQTEVIERSNSVPVFVLFWAEQVPPSVQTKQTLETLMTQYGGKAALALSDVSVDQTLAQHLRVQGLPSLRIVQQGKIVDQIDGPADEAQLRTLLDTLTQSSTDMLQGQLEQVMASGDYDTAVAMLQQSMNEEPNNQGFRVELADVLILKGDLDDARTVLASIADDTPERERPQNRLEFVEEAAGYASAAELEQQLTADADNLELKYQMCVTLVVAQDYEGALNLAMDILRSDREFRDDIGRLTMVRIFPLLGKGSDVAAAYRRKMFNFMH